MAVALPLLAEKPGGHFSGALSCGCGAAPSCRAELELGAGKMLVQTQQLARLDTCKSRARCLPFPTRRYTAFEITRYVKGALDFAAHDSDLSASNIICGVSRSSWAAAASSPPTCCSTRGWRGRAAISR